MRNVFGGLSFNLSRVAAEGAPGTASHGCYDHSGGSRGNLNLAHARMCNISSTARHTAGVCPGVLQLTVALSPQHLSRFSTEETRVLLCCDIWFITIWNSTSARLLCLKKEPPSIPKSKGGKNPRGAALKLTAVIVLCHLACLPGNRKGLIFYDVW